MNQFTERYRALSNSDLLEIVYNPDDYQSLAVTTASKELSSREINEEELEIAKAKKKEMDDRKLAKSDLLKKWNIKTSSIADYINPIQKTKPSANKIITFITIIFGLISIIQIFTQFDLIRFIFFSGKGKLDRSVITYCLPIILLPIGTVLFWKRKKFGWILLTIFILYSALIGLVNIYHGFSRNDLQLSYAKDLFPINTLANIRNVLLLLACLFALSTSAIRKVFTVENKTMLITIVTAILIVSAFFILSY